MATPKLPPIPQQLPKTQAEWDRFVNVMQSWMQALNPALYAQLSGATFTGGVLMAGSAANPGHTVGGIAAGTDPNDGSILWISSSEAPDQKYWRAGIGFDGAGTFSFQTVDDAWTVGNAWLKVTRSGNTPTGISLKATLTLKSNVWHLSDEGHPRLYFGLNDRSYFGSANGYEWQGATGNFLAILDTTGSLNTAGGVIANSGNYYSSNGLFLSDQNDGWMRFNQNGNFANGLYTPHNFRIDGTLSWSGTPNAFLHHISGHASGNVTVSTAAPSGGSDGDIWLQYT